MQTLLKDLVSPEENPDAHLAYITHDDIRQVNEFKDKVVMAIKAPLGTELFVTHKAHQTFENGCHSHVKHAVFRLVCLVFACVNAFVRASSCLSCYSRCVV